MRARERMEWSRKTPRDGGERGSVCDVPSCCKAQRKWLPSEQPALQDEDQEGCAAEGRRSIFPAPFLS